MQKVIHITDHPEAKKGLLERTFREHEPDLRRFLRARVAAQEDRDDVVQELFLRLARIEDLAERLAENSGNTRSYLFAIATNLIVDQQRRAAAQRADKTNSLEEEAIPTTHPTLESVVATREQLETMMELLKKMKPKLRQAFVLNRFKHKSYPEVAKEMGISVASVQRYIATALTSLRRGME